MSEPWPSDHTVSGDSAAQVVLEPGVGGRIFERAPHGRERDWGQVARWEPPSDLAYLWHLGTGATAGDTWRDRNRRGWASLLPHFRTSIERENA